MKILEFQVLSGKDLDLIRCLESPGILYNLPCKVLQLVNSGVQMKFQFVSKAIEKKYLREKSQKILTIKIYR